MDGELEVRRVGVVVDVARKVVGLEVDGPLEEMRLPPACVRELARLLLLVADELEPGEGIVMFPQLRGPERMVH